MRPPVDGFTSRVVVDRVVYVTITMMSVLIIYDGWDQLRYGGVIGVIVGPVVAMFVAHVFAAAIALQVDVKRTLTGAERRRIVQAESRFLFVAVPPLAVIIVLRLAGLSLASSVQVVVWIGAVSLGFWGGVAGRRAGLTGWHLALTVFAGLAVGAVVLMLHLVLQPAPGRAGLR